GTAEPGSLVSVFEGTTLIGTVVAGANGAWSLTTTPLADGTHSYTATATDAAGNTSVPSGSASMTVDTTAPATPAITGVGPDTGVQGDGITSANVITVTGTALAGSTVSVYDNGVLVGTTTANASGIWSFTTPALADGLHPFTATATDASGNQSPATAPSTISIDTAAPAKPSVGSISQDTATPGDRITSDNTLTITGTAEPGSTVKVYDNGNLVGTAVVAANGSYTVTTSVLADGQHPLTITATDAAGNQGAPTNLGTWTIDTAAPAAPQVGSVSVDTATPGDRITSDNTLTVTGTAEAGSTVKVYDNGVLVGTAVADASGNYSVTTNVLADGQHPLSVTSTDVAGNESAPTSIGTWTIDTLAPAAPVINSVGTDTGVQGDRLTADNTLTVAGTAEPGSVVSVIVDGLVLGTVVADANGAWSFTTLPLGDGNHVITATATDAAGNTSAPSAPASMAIDTTFPAIPSITGIGPDTGVQGDSLTSATALTVTGNAEPGSTVALYADGVLVGTATANAQGVFSIPTGTLPSGAHNFVATATDAAGNTS
ncbi:MAG: hemagglutinin, partial [Planctomycetes bacterium]|nr:hemagglutinin [Planctomycetota bacterium]